MRQPSTFRSAILIGLVWMAFFPGQGRSQVQTQSTGAEKPAIAFKENGEIPETLRQETFTFVWQKVRDEYYDPSFGGKDWNAIRDIYFPQIAGAKASGAYHALLGKMVAELGRSHLSVEAPHQVQARSTTNAEPRSTPEGLVLCLAEGQVMIASVKPDTPAWNAGIRSGYIVIKVGETPLPTEEEIRKSPLRALIKARRTLSGIAGSPVNLNVLDENDHEKAVSLPRTSVYQERANLGRSVFEARRVHPRIGYIRFDGWAFDLKPKLEAAMKDLWDSAGLIIDCRQNRGGVDPGVNYLASVLCAEPGLLAVETSRQGERREWKHEGSGTNAYSGRVAILIDGGSGSASEVFAAAMQEKGRAVILGQVSYGGVLNSTQALLPTGGILQYPHSDMRTPQGRSIEGAGVIPDIPVEMTRADLLAGVDTVIERAVETILKAEQK